MMLPARHSKEHKATGAWSPVMLVMDSTGTGLLAGSKYVLLWGTSAAEHDVGTRTGSGEFTARECAEWSVRNPSDGRPSANAISQVSE